MQHWSRTTKINEKIIPASGVGVAGYLVAVKNELSASIPAKRTFKISN